MVQLVNIYEGSNIFQSNLYNRQANAQGRASDKLEISAFEFCYVNMTDGYINIVLKYCIWQRNKKYSFGDIPRFSLQENRELCKTQTSFQSNMQKGHIIESKSQTDDNFLLLFQAGNMNSPVGWEKYI